MSSPAEMGIHGIQRLGPYLEGKKRLVYTYRRQEVDKIDVYSGTGWTGCPRTRKSTSGGCAMLGAYMIKAWPPTQPSQALPSGEAEYHGSVGAADAGLACQALLGDLGPRSPYDCGPTALQPLASQLAKVSAKFASSIRERFGCNKRFARDKWGCAR